jgi:hypothetical protein
MDNFEKKASAFYDCSVLKPQPNLISKVSLINAKVLSKFSAYLSQRQVLERNHSLVYQIGSWFPHHIFYLENAKM